jgi:glycerol-3-phosphate dehydrogenase (NAD(P)+)
VGTGAWGTTLAYLLAANGNEPLLVCRSIEEARILRSDGENRRFRPGLRFPPALRIRNRPDVIAGCELVAVAVPAASMRANLRRIQPFVRPGVPVVCATKGIEVETALTMPEVMASEGLQPQQVCVLSGPNFSTEIAAGLPAATVIAGADAAVAAARAAFSSDRFRVYVSSDVAGVALGGALKNIVAIACGISDGLGLGQNAKAALMTRGLAEIARLGAACGASQATFMGLAGVGDLIATCESDLSRNRRFGLAIAAGRGLAEALAEADGVVEGVPTTRAALSLAVTRGVEMPIAAELEQVLFHGKTPAQSMTALMRRAPTVEFH